MANPQSAWKQPDKQTDTQSNIHESDSLQLIVRHTATVHQTQLKYNCLTVQASPDIIVRPVSAQISKTAELHKISNFAGSSITCLRHHLTCTPSCCSSCMGGLYNAVASRGKIWMHMPSLPAGLPLVDSRPDASNH
jgi:hypothetical protein